jgi:argininosuccinate lyase
MNMADYKLFSDIFEDDIKQDVDLFNCVNSRNVKGGPSCNAVIHQIENARKKLNKLIDGKI